MKDKYFLLSTLFGRGSADKEYADKVHETYNARMTNAQMILTRTFHANKAAPDININDAIETAKILAWSADVDGATSSDMFKAFEDRAAALADKMVRHGGLKVEDKSAFVEFSNKSCRMAKENGVSLSSLVYSHSVPEGLDSPN